MARVTVTALEPLAERLGSLDKPQVTFEEEIHDRETLEDFVRRLANAHPRLGGITFSPASDAMVPAYRIHVNRVKVPQYDWPTATLKDGDHILFTRMG